MHINRKCVGCVSILSIGLRKNRIGNFGYGEIMNESLPTVEQANLDNFYDVVRKLDPELYLIKIALQETGVNPMILPRIVRSIFNLAEGTGYGKVQVFIQNKMITHVKGEESDEVNEKAVIDK